MMNRLSINTNKNLIQVEDYDDHGDAKFVKEFLTPYFKDLYKDLTLRCFSQNAV